jgi:predicted secreted acid phosphatase
VAFVGDKILDFPAGSQDWRSDARSGILEWGGRFFMMPNPMYGSWQPQ